MIAGIAIANAVYAMDKPYSYRVPQSLSLSLGQRVTVPFGFGNTRTEGLVLSLEEGDREGLKNVEGVLEAEPLLSDTQLRLAAFLRERYFCTFYDAVRAILPAGYWFREKETVSLTEDRSWETASIRKEGAKELLIYLRDQGGGCREPALGAVIPEEDKRREVLGYLVRKKWIQAEKDFTRKGGDKLERIALLAVAGTHLSRLVAQIHFVQHIHKWRKLAADGIGSIHAIADGDKADALLPEIDFRVEACLHIIASYAAEVFGDDGTDFACVDVRNELFPAGALEVAATEAVVCVVTAIGEAMLVSIAFKLSFLRRDLSRCVFARQCTIRIDKQQKERYNNAVIDNDIII